MKLTQKPYNPRPSLVRSHKVSWQEKLSNGQFVDKSFTCPQEHLEFHMQNLRKSPALIYNPTYRNI